MEIRKMVGQPRVWYLEERAEQLALLYLSRRNDLRVTKLHDDYGIDLLVEIYQDNHPTGRMFGVLLKAQVSQDQEHEQIDTKISSGEMQSVKDLPFPLCLFVFVMDNDAAYYLWVKQPLVAPEGFPHLVINDVAQIKTLTKESINDIVQQVERWYEAKTIQAN
jgi:hypothetical protein